MDVCHAIRARADEVREHGEYIGFFEWLVWGILSGVRVHMVIGTSLLDVIAVFAPSMGIVDIDGDSRRRSTHTCTHTHTHTHIHRGAKLVGRGAKLVGRGAPAD